MPGPWGASKLHCGCKISVTPPLMPKYSASCQKNGPAQQAHRARSPLEGEPYLPILLEFGRREFDRHSIINLVDCDVHTVIVDHHLSDTPSAGMIEGAITGCATS